VIILYNLEKLPYSYDALEPFIDTHTLGLHHEKHERNYINKLNELLVKNNYKFNYDIIELNYHLTEFNEEDQKDILFNLGGVINHEMYFNCMSPNKEMPNAMLQKKIQEEFGSMKEFKKKFKESALKLKGSGYTYLVIEKGHLKIINLENQDNPYYHNYVPLICIDMWEHAYYLNYENKKDIYIDNFLEIMSFKKANQVIANNEN